MPRRRDDDDDDRDREYDDRPRRRKRSRYDEAPPKSNTGLILLVVGLAVGLPLLVCVGVAAWGFLEVKKVGEQMGAGFEAEAGAEEFFEALSRNDVTAAYDAHTTAAFRAGTSREAFTKLVRANPVLTASNWPTSSTVTPKPTGSAPNRTLTLTYTVAPDEEDDGMDDFDPDTPRRPNPPPRPNAARPKSVTCTVVVAEQPNGSWKVDKFTIP
jgi:cellulase/cellobiase CelA1